ncbi:ArnT family glycosyltransferase [Hymenobacter properus]|uniref:Glycosyltransferase family 39 protein n=1 Tax=Hymenobacter properus TaxID=2791026 RepID=A0A931FNX9_9BACT|nr:glycosyltransferase family 39 protein [Hymenobacter properus]MBF9143084.1 glycosyltransferase family 39 protein [Hymenobacter properus]MBR7721892.1 glycosyltransferase family 39 protein [Microvirga sp. SRT04]
MNTLNLLLLSGAGLLLTASLWLWYRRRIGSALVTLMGASFLLRLLMAALDPFLHDWDERYHALVAKHLMSHPLAPMLRLDQLLPYDYQAWCCNHIWLHKQPLFMWQMALSMAVFGTNELALRLPSVVLGTLVLYPAYRIGRLLFNADTGYALALLLAVAHYQLEQTSGLIGMDHNDVAFGVYITASLWAYYEYRTSRHPTKWLVLVGVLAGASVLCKWLVGLLVYASWGTAIVLEQPRRVSEYLRLGAALLITVVVALPWQLYTAWRFPLESSYERAYNSRHFGEALEGHSAAWYYHLNLLPLHYGWVLLGLMLLGFAIAAYRGWLLRLLPLLVAVLAVYTLFSLAATKMYSYTYVVSSVLLLLAALPVAAAWQWLRQAPSKAGIAGAVLLGATVVLFSLRPAEVYSNHLDEGVDHPFWPTAGRAARLNNAVIYRQLDRDVPAGYVVFNALGGDEITAMFYANRPVYSWWPSQAQVQRLQALGWHIAYFPDHHDQHPPDYIRQAPGALPLWGQLQ